MNIYLFKSTGSGNAGFSLVEVLVGFAIFAVAMISVMSMTIQAQRMGQTARTRMEVLQHARATLEDLMSEPYRSAELEVGTRSVSRGGFNGTVTVTEPDLNQRKQITVSFGFLSFGTTEQLQLQMDLSNALH